MNQAESEAKRKAWIFQEYYGLPQAPTVEDCLSFIKAMMVCADGDGELSSAERDWVIGFALANGVSHAEIDELANYDGSDNIDDLIKSRPILPSARRVVLFDAIRACDSDGDYSAGERKTIRKMAGDLGLTESDVDEVESAWESEKKARMHRLKVIWPAGAPA